MYRHFNIFIVIAKSNKSKIYSANSFKNSFIRIIIRLVFDACPSAKNQVIEIRRVNINARECYNIVFCFPLGFTAVEFEYIREITIDFFADVIVFVCAFVVNDCYLKGIALKLEIPQQSFKKLYTVLTKANDQNG